MPDMNRRTLLQSIPALALLGQAGFGIPTGEVGIFFDRSLRTKGLSHLRRKAGRSAHPFSRTHYADLREARDEEHRAIGLRPTIRSKGKTLIYVIAHASRDAATANWKAFGEDPDWISVRDKSEANGKLVEKVDSTFMVLTDFSPRL